MHVIHPVFGSNLQNRNYEHATKPLLNTYLPLVSCFLLIIGRLQERKSGHTKKAKPGQGSKGEANIAAVHRK